MIPYAESHIRIVGSNAQWLILVADEGPEWILGILRSSLDLSRAYKSFVGLLKTSRGSDLSREAIITDYFLDIQGQSHQLSAPRSALL
jgi:hypothetical protein